MDTKNIPLINRQISWLYFNDRVLQEAGDPTVPLIERIPQHDNACEDWVGMLLKYFPPVHPASRVHK